MGKYRNCVVISVYQWRYGCFVQFTWTSKIQLRIVPSRPKWESLTRCISKNNISCPSFVYGCVPTCVLPLRESQQKVRKNVATIVIVQTRLQYAVARVVWGNVEQRLIVLGYRVCLPLSVTTVKCGAVTISVPLRHVSCQFGPSYW